MTHDNAGCNGIRAACEGCHFEISLGAELPRHFSDEAIKALLRAERGAALALPAGRFEFQELLEGGLRLLRRDRHRKTHLAVVSEAIALAAQLFQLLRAERILKQRLGAGRCMEQSALLPVKRTRHHSRFRERLAQRLRGRALLGEHGNKQRKGSRFASRLQQSFRRFLCSVFIQQGHAERRIAVPSDQHRQREFQRTPRRSDRQEPDEFLFRGTIPCKQRADLFVARNVPRDRKRPLRRIKNVRFDRARIKAPPCADGNRFQRDEFGRARRFRPQNDCAFAGETEMCINQGQLPRVTFGKLQMHSHSLRPRKESLSFACVPSFLL